MAAPTAAPRPQIARPVDEEEEASGSFGHWVLIKAPLRAPGASEHTLRIAFVATPLRARVGDEESDTTLHLLARLGRASRSRSIGCLEGTLNSGKGQGHCFSLHRCMGRSAAKCKARRLRTNEHAFYQDS